MDDINVLGEDRKVLLRQSQAELIRLLDALATLDKSKEWATLKELVFDRAVTRIERQILTEALSQKIDESKLYKLQGEWAWAKQYSDMDRYADTLKNQLKEIKNLLK